MISNSRGFGEPFYDGSLKEFLRWNI